MKLSRPANIIVPACFGVLTLLALASYLMLCWAFGSSPFHPNPYDTLRFNQRSWLQDQSCVDGSNRRGHMAEDITHHYLHPGMSQAQIAALLGAPDHIYTRAQVQHHLTAYKQGDKSEIYFQPRDLQAARVDDYYLGEELSLLSGIDRAGLYLYMDPQGRYSGCRIHAP